MNKKIILILIIIIIIIFPFYFTLNTYHADSLFLSHLNGTDYVNITGIDKGLFIDGKGNDTAIIFYP